MTHHALGGRDFEDLGHVKQTNSFIVNGSAGLVCFVVAMRIVVLNLIVLYKVIRFNDLIYTLSLAPVDEVLEHHHDLR